MSEATAPQAEPVDGRSFPTKARGARPTFFDDDGATDAIVAIVTALAAEVWTLRERIDTLEAVLDATDVIDRSTIATYRPAPDEADDRANEAAAFTARVFRVFEEMREEAVAGETEAQYRAIVERAFDEI
jgi:hypothetical protein